ncbi:hypothetical protein PAUR_a3297 [Pseudoalteromonas aurantia 208]|uniref:Uncharacterized protein n=1 Tax=Pseudoalteromonas aurantia 208 TaxID=1314867 RepID=A0ABR9E5N6_9GAMM|nr:hypothetical protein [Pseudoalteromonas aurantia 208]
MQPPLCMKFNQIAVKMNLTDQQPLISIKSLIYLLPLPE